MKYLTDEQSDEGSSFGKNVKKGVVIIIVFMMVIALLSFFFNMQAAIYELIDPRYEKLVQAVFSLSMLVAAAYLLKTLLLK